MRQRRVGRGLGEVPPRLQYTSIFTAFSIFSRIFSDFTLSSFRLYLFVLSLDQELLTDWKFIRSESYAILLRKYHNISPIRKVRGGTCFVNKSRTNEDKKLGFSRLHTRDTTVWKFTQAWLVYVLIDRILAQFNNQ
jgi:hypothetical protein